MIVNNLPLSTLCSSTKHYQWTAVNCLRGIMKKCGRCREILPDEMFCKNNQTITKLNCYCRNCAKIRNNKWRENNIEIARASSKNWCKNNKENLANKALKHNYKISLDEKHFILLDQDYKCAVCGKVLILTGIDSHTDHNHETGIVRGVLCRDCNHMIGNAHESIHNLELAIEYLKKHQ